MTILTNPTCCSAADNFLAYFSDTINLVMMLQGQDAFKEHLEGMVKLLRGQLASLKTLLKVEQFDQFDTNLIEKLENRPDLPLAETAEQKDRELLSKEYELKGEDCLWVTVAKINAYVDILTTAETVARQSSGNFHKLALDVYMGASVS